MVAVDEKLSQMHHSWLSVLASQVTYLIQHVPFRVSVSPRTVVADSLYV